MQMTIKYANSRTANQAGKNSCKEDNQGTTQLEWCTTIDNKELHWQEKGKAIDQGLDAKSQKFPTTNSDHVVL